MTETENYPVVVILGPTAVGKSEISLRLAESFHGEIISADSRLVYRGMDIGTAKPTPEDRARVTHHLIDVVRPDEAWSLAIFQDKVLQLIRKLDGRGVLPFLVGGTGQYLVALLEGWKPPLTEVNQEFRREAAAFAKEHGSLALYEKLVEIDPQMADQIDHSNVRRVIRALEIFHATGTRPSEARGRKAPPLRSLRIGLVLPRDELYARIDARIEDMLKNGLVDEVKALLAQGYAPDLPAFSAIGYRQIIDYLQGTIGLDEAVAQMKRQTRQLVRRQANWFKEDDPAIHWYSAEPAPETEIQDLIRSWL